MTSATVVKTAPQNHCCWEKRTGGKKGRGMMVSWSHSYGWGKDRTEKVIPPGFGDTMLPCQRLNHNNRKHTSSYPLPPSYQPSKTTENCWKRDRTGKQNKQRDPLWSTAQKEDPISKLNRHCFGKSTPTQIEACGGTQWWTIATTNLKPSPNPIYSNSKPASKD